MTAISYNGLLTILYVLEFVIVFLCIVWFINKGGN